MRAQALLSICILTALSACSGGNGTGEISQLGGVPLAPGDPVASVQSPAVIDLSWAPSSNATPNTLYWIERDGTPVGFTTGLTFHDVGLVPNATYSYVLFAQGSGGAYSSPSNATLATTPNDVSPPSVPSEVTALFLGLPNGSHEVRVEWTSSTDNGFVEGYRVLRDGAQIATTVAGVYLDGAFLPGVQHCYEIIPFDTAGNEPPSGPRACVHTAWEHDEITTLSALGRNASIAVSTMDRIDVVHGDGAGLGVGSGLLVSSTWDGLEWANGLILVDTLFESSFDIEYDVNLDLHLAALRRGPNLGLVHAKRKGGNWSAELVDSQGLTGLEPRIAVADDLTVHIAQFNSHGALRYGVGSGDEWQVQTVSGPGTTQAAGATALSPSGDPHFCFGLDGTGLLLHAWSDGEGLKSALLTDGVNTQVPPAAVFAADGTLHVVFQSVLGRIRHAWGRPGGAFALELVSPLNVLAAKPDLTRTPDGVLHVSYFDLGRGALMYSSDSQGFWSGIVVDDAPSLSDRQSIDAGTDGSLAIAYRAGGTLRVARQL